MKPGRNELCWCGSGRKFKKCHLNTNIDIPLNPQSTMNEARKIFGKKYCMSSESNKCNGNIVKAHTV
jgi:hypothetical protein